MAKPVISSRATASALLAFLAIPSAVSAQGRARSPTVLFAPTGNFQNPGARPFGLGGAFIALADDASAAELNPAGLTQLRRAEVSAEYRRLETTTPVEYPNSLSAGPFECAFAADVGDRCSQSFRSRQDSVPFVSLVVPSGRNLTLAFYRHELDRERVSIVRPALDFPGFVQLPGSTESLDRRIVRTGLSVAYAVRENLSAGITVNLNSMTQQFRAIEFFTEYSQGGAAGDASPTLLSIIQESHIQSQKLGGTGGLYWRPWRPVSFGFSYSAPVQFEEHGIRNTCFANASTGLPRCDFIGGAPDPSNVYTLDEISSTFTLPSRFGVSAAVRPTSWLLLIAETDRVSYSDNDNDLQRFDVDGAWIGFDRLSAPDVWELHAGAEAVLSFGRTGLLGIRAGYWRDPDHSFRYSGCRPLPGKTCESDSLFPETHPPVGNRDHYAAGLGIAWSWGQIDVGYDWVRQTRVGTVAASLVIRAK